jgi:murein DD-endopeptidase MepM/ murein hydrolase activator NlpD
LASLRKKISTRFKNRYRVILRQDENLEEKASLILTPLNVLIISSAGLLIFGTIIYLLLAYTPLNYIFPTKSAKYSNMEQYSMIQKIDSLENRLYQLNLQSEVLRKVLAGEDVAIDLTDIEPSTEELSQTTEIATTGTSAIPARVRPASSYKQSYDFYVPIKGVISDTFNVDKKHLGIDIAASLKEVIKCVQDGTVIFSAWTPSVGHTVVVQHANSFVSVYKHNAALLKKEGTFVKAGDAIALVGNTGELSSGPHLHFELWKNGVAVNPSVYINF